ncbi:MotE family protein [Salsuginibacillus kocurii]|uniref:MotE family protein n=1 Tax=Salsuginibacillus kocurii TaxID=427078 RepID=UPI00037E4C49|nr:hypothetical protein [Salsuginibacillus kocurii]
MARKEKNEQKGPNRLQWFFFIVMIPGFFAVLLAGVMLYFMGFNLADTARSIGGAVPIVSDWMPEEEEEEGEGPSREELLAMIDRYEHEIDALEQELEEQEEDYADLANEFEELEIELELEEEFSTDVQEEISRLARVYENMSSDDAAAILMEMSTEEILLHMSEMDEENRADILSEMDAELAATIMQQFAAQE